MSPLLIRKVKSQPMRPIGLVRASTLVARASILVAITPSYVPASMWTFSSMPPCRCANLSPYFHDDLDVHAVMPIKSVKREGERVR